ncbi:hypothetical protein FB45DRAFT_1104752 [Roridomyces roridus]|uniref:Membrane-associated protein n=1 Tax=Roridomyces roridus TaxID=1738132 RepID=A0AAD7FFL5_9AGAR|nr:hypothetical protein FB45DRAFT_1104752 [Roridomyces roridus]
MAHEAMPRLPRRTVYILALVALAVLSLSRSAFTESPILETGLTLLKVQQQQPDDSLVIAESHPPPPPQPKKRVYLRAGSIGKEGLGSVLQHFKHSIVFSRALDSTLVLSSSGNWDYSTSEIFNEQLKPEDYTVDVRNACRISDHVPADDRSKLVRGLCNGEEEAERNMTRIAGLMDNCTSILDLEDIYEKDGERFGEVTEDLNGCVMDWVRERLAPTPISLAPLTYPLNRPIRVGIHIRWSDMAHKLPEGEFYFSMSMYNITRILADIRRDLGPVEVTVAMREADESVLTPLKEGGHTYTLLDSRDWVGDIRELSRCDVLLVGESSFAVLAHMVAPPGLTIVELTWFNHQKYSNSTGFGRNMVYLTDYLPATLRQGLGLPPAEAVGAEEDSL